MATSTFSIVKIKGEKRLQIAYMTVQKKYVQCSVNDEQLSLALLAKKQASIDSLKNVEVEFEEENEKPVKVREKGKEWDHPVPIVEEIIEREIDGRAEGDFHNPYNFVPALLRDNDKVENSELGDRNPLKVGMGHGVYQPDRWSGRIAVTLKTKTPLLIPDIFDSEEENGHKTYPLRLGADGKPYLPPTSIKGMLRSAYEAVTNSRLSVLEKHDARLFYRMNATDGLSLIPARIEGNQIKLMCGTTTGIPKLNTYNQRWLLPNNLMYAAWLPRYRNRHNVGYVGMKHEAHVHVWIELWQKVRRDRDGNIQPIFKYWLVRKIVPSGQNLGLEPEPSRGYGNHQPVANEPIISTNGYVCITNKNINNKHDERVFFSLPDSLQHTEPSVNHQTDWKYLIADYQKIHQGEERDEDLNWSRHVLGGAKELTLSKDTLCYAYVEEHGNSYKIKRLYPVMISRAIHEKNPISLLTKDLHPATNMDDLSPSDRVFGWVNQDKNGKGAYKGNLRIHSVNCASDDSIHEFDGDGLPLAILGQPKPQQARFYAAKNKEGDALEVGIKKEEGYGIEAEGLRGRKVYPHHRLPMNAQEYSQTDRSDQNRSIRAWVKPETEFKFDIDVTNLSSVELGGLLWLLSLPENHYHRLGGGKPFGFGSVSLAIDWEKTDLRNGKGWKEFYSELSLVSTSDNDTAKQTIQAFKNQVVAVYGNNSFQSVKFIRAFCTSAKGFDDGKPVHYPRLDRVPNADSNIFEWFVENESTRGQGLSLPNLTTDRGLFYSP